MNNYNEYIKKINSVMMKTDYLYSKWAKDHSVSNYVLNIMYMLRTAGINKQKDIADIYGMPKQTVNTVIAELNKKGYIRLIPDEKDKRSKIIELTEEGVKYADSIVEPLLEYENKVLEKMGRKRVEMMIEALRQYADLFEDLST